MWTRLAFMSALLLAPLSTQAADLPKQGTDSYTTTYVVTSFSLMKAGDRSVANSEAFGITRNDNGGAMFNNMGARCQGGMEAVGGVAMTRGTCVETDKDGDEIISTYEAKGGTGKYTGLSGTATYTTQPIKSPDGRGMAIVVHKATWKLP